MHARAMSAQAMGFYRWMNHVVFTANEPLVINMDECSLKLTLTGLSGTIADVHAGHKATLAACRGAMTLMSCVSSDTGLNQRLPQILLGNQHPLSKRVLAAAAADPVLKASNLHIWCEKTSWVTVEVMLKFLHSLSVAVDALKGGDRTIVLVMDMAPPHLAAPVARAIRDRGWRAVLIPAKCTAFLQPLDTNILAVLRKTMAECWVTTKGELLNGSMTTLEWLRMTEESVRRAISERDWSHAFLQTGLLGQQLYLGKRLRHQLNWGAGKTAPTSMPTLHQAATLFPRGKTANVALWLHGLDHCTDPVMPALD